MSSTSLVRRDNVIESIEVVIYSAYFLLPGYIIGEIIRHFIPEREFGNRYPASGLAKM